MREKFLALGMLGSLACSILFAAAGGEVKETILTGRVICLGEGNQPLRAGEVCEDQFPPRFGFEADDGKFYLFKADDARTVMFTDPRVREKTLRISAWATDQELEIIKVHAVREGRIFDLYYYCAVCHIVAYTPGPCWCCQDDFDFVEEPLREEIADP